MVSSWLKSLFFTGNSRRSATETRCKDKLLNGMPTQIPRVKGFFISSQLPLFLLPNTWTLSHGQAMRTGQQKYKYYDT